MRLKSVPPSTLVGLANRCLIEVDSRALDAEIYCAFHAVKDGNDLSCQSLIDIHNNGHILITQFGHSTWIESPRFTSEMKFASMLVPSGLYTISKNPRIVCATALTAMAIIDARPFSVDFLNKGLG